MYGYVYWLSWANLRLCLDQTKITNVHAYKDLALKLHLIFQGPSVLFGAIAKNTNWEAAGYLCGAPSDESDDSTPTKVDHGI